MKHYLKIPFSIREYYPGVAPSDWRRSLFDDATERGTTLHVLPLPPNAQGVRAALFGSDFYFEVGRDLTRSDALFLTRVEPAGGSRLPRAVPKVIKATFMLWEGPDPPRLDGVDYVFRGDAPSSDPEAADDDDGEELPSEPVPLLLDRLCGLGPECAAGWRPGTEPQVPEDAGQFIALLKRPWQRLRMDRYLTMSPRHESLLRGLVRPRQLDSKEKQALLRLFGFPLLNPLVLDPTVDLAAALRELQALPLPVSIRHAMWAAMLRGWRSLELRKELLLSATGLRNLTEAESERIAWIGSVVPLLTDAASAAPDESLLEVLTGADEGTGDALERLAAWTARLDDGAVEVASTPTESETVDERTNAGEPDIGRQPAMSSDLVDGWVVRFRGIDVERIAALMQDSLKASEAALGRPMSAARLAGLETLVVDVRDVSRLLDALSAALPDVDSLREDQAKAAEAFSRATQLLGDGAAALLESPGITPEQLDEVCQLLSRETQLAALPAWIWTDGAAVDLPSRLLNPDVRRHVRLLLDYIDRLEEPAVVNWLTPPAPGRSIPDHLDEWFQQVRDFLIQVPEGTRHLLQVQSPSDFATASEYAAHLAHLRRVLVDDEFAVASAELNQIPDPGERALRANAYCEAARFLKELTQHDGHVPLAMLRGRAETLLKERVQTPVEAHPQLAIEHNWMEASGSKASVSLARPDPSKNYGVIAVPLVFVTDRPRAVDGLISWEVRDRVREDWPGEWPDPQPAGPIRVPLVAWRKQPERDVYHYSLIAQFPVRSMLIERRPRLEIAVTLSERQDSQSITHSQVLRWENVVINPPRVATLWRDETNPEYVTAHPIGPQRHAQALLKRLESGSSVAAVAPRRFGKSTLVQYLHAAARAAKLCAPPPIQCTAHSSNGHLDFDALWAWVSDRLQAEVGSGLRRDWSGPLPNEQAFDDARKAAKRKNKKAIVLLFDEAQLLFPQRSGAKIGSDLKRLLESTWSRSSKDMVPVLVGMIGLPSLPHRAPDLMGVLMPKQGDELREIELKPLIARLAPGLQTTLGARERLAESSGNLLTLRAMLDRLADRVNQEQRLWANYDDVASVHDGLKQDLRAGREPSVALYVRDVLNNADSVDDWRPLPSFPVAVAIADTKLAGNPDDSVPQIVTRLNRWCEQYAVRGSTSTLTYDEQRVSEHLRDLTERGVLGSDGFNSDLLHAWLAGIARRQAFDEEFKRALFAGAHRRIEIRDLPAPVAGGGQADIRVAEGKAYRSVRLMTDDDRRRFEQQAEVLEALQKVVANRESGADHIFELIDMGLSARDENEAIQVYRWIDGEDLASRRGTLSRDIVLDLSLKLARAVRLMHRNNIIHRDIHPRNVILDTKSDPESMRPVLIDFGFARFAAGSMLTKLSGDHLAPEAQRTPPEWSRATDIYSFGWSMKALLAPHSKDTARFIELLDRCQDAEPGRRPTAEDVVQQLGELADEYKLEDRRRDVRTAIQRAAGQDVFEAWFGKVLRANISKLVSTRMGFFPSTGLQIASAADFLNQVVEECPKAPVNLGALEGRATTAGLDVARVLWAMRAGGVHAPRTQNPDTKALIAAFERLTPAQQRELFLTGIEMVGKVCGLRNLLSAMQEVVTFLD